MKKIVYSVFTKLIAVLLAICCLAAGVNIAINAVSDYFANSDLVYNFESDFSQATCFYPLFYDINCAVRGAYSEVYDAQVESDGNSRAEPVRDSDVTVVRVPSEVLQEKIVVYYDDPWQRENKAADDVENEKNPQPKIYVMNADGAQTEERKQHEADKTKELLACISQNLGGANIAGKAEYFLSVNGSEISNTDKAFDELKNSEVSFWYERSGAGVFFGSSGTSFADTYVLDGISTHNSEDTITLCTSIAPEYLARCKTAWYSQESGVRQAFFNILILVILVLLLMVYLCAVAGKTANGEIKLMWIDKIWTEIHLAAAFAATVGVLVAGVMMCEMYVHERFPLYMLRYISLAATVAGACVVITCI